MADTGTGITGQGSDWTPKGGLMGKTLEECKAICDDTAGCNSIVWRYSETCWLKEKCLTLAEPSLPGNTRGYKSYYIPCTGPGMPMLIHYYDYY